MGFPIFSSPFLPFLIFSSPFPHISAFKSNLPVHTYLIHIWIISVTQDSSGNIGNWACVEVAILNTYSRYNLDLASTGFLIHSVFKNFHYNSGERIQKVADSYAWFTGYVWTKVKSAKKKIADLKIFGYTYGRDLNHTQAALEPLWGRADTRHVSFLISCFYNCILRSIHLSFEIINPFYVDFIYLLTRINIYDSWTRVIFRSMNVLVSEWSTWT